MPRTFSFGLALSLYMITAPEAFALGGNHPAGKINQVHTGWPQGTLELANSDARVHGCWVNQNDFFYYQGDAASVNKFLESYGNLPETPLIVVIHVGVVPLASPFGEERKIRYDWKMEIFRRGWGVPNDPRRPQNDPGYVVTVHVWLSDNLILNELKIPKHIEVRSANDIERFIEQHRTKWSDD